MLQEFKQQFIILQKLLMENQKNNSSLQQKLQLLKALRSGKYEQSQKILANLSATSRTNPQLYKKFHSFLQEHRQGIEQIQRQQKQQEQKIVLVEGSDDDEWITDDSVSLETSQQENEIQIEEKQGNQRLMKNISNTKSTTLLQSLKQAKKPFMVQTKTKDSKTLNSNLKQRNSSSIKFESQNKSLISTLSKSSLLPKTLQKQESKPYFPPINGAKNILKINK